MLLVPIQEHREILIELKYPKHLMRLGVNINTLWLSFILLTIFNAGNMNYQQDIGMYEINPLYGRHPSHEQVYVTKALGIAGVYGLTKAFPEHKKQILIGANTVALGFIYYDHKQGIEMQVRF
jgi:hypothetical protein